MQSNSVYFPIFLNIKKSKFLIIGGGNIALAKLENIIQYTSNIIIVAQKISEQVQIIAIEKNLQIINASYSEKHLEFGDIIIAATNESKINQQISIEAREAGKIVNIVDSPQLSDFIFGANIKRGNLNIAVSTSGISPVLARFIKQKIHKVVPENITLLNEFIAKNRDLVKEKLTKIQPRRLFWEHLLESNFSEEVLSGNFNKAQTILDQALNNKANINQVAVYFISAGPGDPELITLKAIKLLSKADVVLYDRLVAKDILNYARRDALKINVGKREGCHSYPQQKINDMMLKYAKEGEIVARLKGGDATIFAHLSEELEQLATHNINFQIVPGVSAALGAAAYSGFPLTSRDTNSSLRFLTLYKENFLDNKYWQNLAESNDALVFYMSSNNANIIVDNLIKFGKNPQTKLVVIEQATTIYQKTYISSLNNFTTEFGDKKFISPSLIVIGNVVQWSNKFSWKEENLNGKFF